MKAIKIIFGIIITAGFAYLAYFLFTNKVNVEYAFTKDNMPFEKVLIPCIPFLATVGTGIIGAIIHRSVKRVFIAIGIDIATCLFMLSTEKVRLLGDMFLIGYGVMFIASYFACIILIVANGGNSDYDSEDSDYDDVLNGITGDEVFIDPDGGDIDVSDM